MGNLASASTPLQKQRNGALDLMKFVFALMIVLHHSYRISGVGEKYGIFESGVEAIDFFFIVSGFLMAASAAKRIASESKTGLGAETVQFLKSRILPLLPYAFFAFFFALAVRFALQGTSFISGLTSLANTVWELLFLKMTGLKTTSVNPVTWYLSAMFLVMAFLYPLLRRHFDLLSKVVFPASAVLLYGWTYMQYHSIRGSSSFWTGLMYKGTLRAAAGLMLGVGVYAFLQATKSLRPRGFVRLLLSVVEWGGYASVFYLTYRQSDNRFDYLIILIFAVCITITCSQKGLISPHIRGKLFLFLGKYSMVLYLNHYVWTVITPVLLPNAGYRTLIFAYVLFSLVWSLVVLAGVTLLQKAGIYKKCKQLLFLPDPQPEG